MKLWIDGQCLQTPSRLRGIGRYVQEFIRGIAEGDAGVELSISFNAAMRDEALAARDAVGQWIKAENIHVWHGAAEAGEAIAGYTEKRRLSEIAIAHHIACLRPDIALSASPFEGMHDIAVPLRPIAMLGVPVASIFYDAIPHRFAGEYLPTAEQKAYYYRRLAFYRDFDLNLCISDYSRTEAIALAEHDRAVNISAGVSAHFLELLQGGAERHPAMPAGRFVLYAGALDWRKNVGAVVDAFALLPGDSRRDVTFVLAGDHPASLLDEVRVRWAERGLPSANFVALGHVSDSHLVSLNRHAALVVQPSLLEGFGLTALEAMMCGTPVIGSNTGALPEVLGDPELMFDPRQPREIAARMNRILSDAEVARQVVVGGLARAGQFTWARSAAIATEALQSAVSAVEPVAAPALPALRKQTFAALGSHQIAADFVAETLARAEPVASAGRRFLVDATSTIRIDHGTGIQRVTKQIIANMLRDDRSGEVGVIYGDSHDGFFPVTVEPDRFEASVARGQGSQLRLRGGDTVLMLDSSWEFHGEHLHHLLSGRLRGAEVVSCLYDTVPLRYAAMCGPGMPPAFAAWIRSALTYSTGFVCISQAVADEFIAMLEAIRFPRRMKVGFWHLGADFGSGALPVAAEAAAGQRPPRFLMVGTIEPRKGHRVALEAFETLWREGVEAELVIVGRPGWGVEHLRRQIEDHPEAGRRLHWHPRVDDAELLELYAGSDALIAASFAEGFGLPIVEARHFGKPVIASDIAVFREVTSGARSARFFETGSPEALADAVRGFLAESPAEHKAEAEERPWASWAESAGALRALIDEERWYRVYEPQDAKPYVSVFDLGETDVRGRLDEAATRHRIELVEGPFLGDGGETLDYIVRLTNLSDTVWSSTGPTGVAHGVRLGYRVFKANGKMLSAENPRSPIPLVLIPGDSHYLPVRVPISMRKKGGAFLTLEVVQEGVRWWGNPLRVPL